MGTEMGDALVEGRAVRPVVSGAGEAVVIGEMMASASENDSGSEDCDFEPCDPAPFTTAGPRGAASLVVDI